MGTEGERAEATSSSGLRRFIQPVLSSAEGVEHEIERYLSALGLGTDERIAGWPSLGDAWTPEAWWRAIRDPQWGVLWDAGVSLPVDLMERSIRQAFWTRVAQQRQTLTRIARLIPWWGGLAFAATCLGAVLLIGDRTAEAIVALVIGQAVGVLFYLVATLLVVVFLDEEDWIVPGMALGLAAWIGSIFGLTELVSADPSPDALGMFLLGLGLAALTLLFAMGVVAARAALGARWRDTPVDPWPWVICALVQALAQIGDSGLWPDDEWADIERYEAGGPVLALEDRRRVARTLDRCAARLLAPEPLGLRRLSPAVRTDLRETERHVAAWLRARAADAMAYSPVAIFDLAEQLARALGHACEGRWDALVQPGASAPKASLLRRYLPRIALAALVLLSAFVVPELAGLENAAANDVRKWMLAAAVTLLLAPPGPAIGDALRDARSRLK